MKNCLVCKGKKFIPYLKAGKNYQLQMCTNCNLVFDPNPLAFNEKLYSKYYYESTEVKGGYFNYFEESIINKLTFKDRLVRIDKKIGNKNAKLLDLGTALGDFLEVARSLLWKNIFGTDISDFAVKICREKGLNVYKDGEGGNSKEILQNNSFKVITLHDVIEHFADPESELKKIRELLQPKGLLFITTPDINSLSVNILGKYWYHYKKGEHLYYFNKNNIKILLERLNFEDIIVKPTVSWVTIKYLINRLSYYLPKKWTHIINFFKSSALFQIAFPIYTGEMEIWAYKKMNYEVNY